MEFKSKLNSVKMGGKKSKKQLRGNRKCYKFLQIVEEVPKLYKDYFKMVNIAAYDSKHGIVLKTLTLKQMIQRLLIALAQVKAGNTSGNLLNENLQIIYSFKNIMNSIKLSNNMSIIFMNSRNSGTSKPHRQLLSRTEKINVKKSKKCAALLNLNIYYTWENIKKSYKHNEFKYKLQHGMKSLNCSVWDTQDLKR